MMLSIMQLRRTAMVLVSAPAFWHSASIILGQLIFWFTEAKPPCYLPTALALAFAAVWRGSRSILPLQLRPALQDLRAKDQALHDAVSDAVDWRAIDAKEEADGAVDDLMRVAESTGCTFIDGRKISLLRCPQCMSEVDVLARFSGQIRRLTQRLTQRCWEAC